MNLQPSLESELIILRPLRKSDFKELFEVAKDPLIWEQHPDNDRYKKEVYPEKDKQGITNLLAWIFRLRNCEINKPDKEV